MKVICRPRYTCQACDTPITQAPAALRPIDGGMTTEVLIAHVLISKFADHLPLYRQAQIFLRRASCLIAQLSATGSAEPAGGCAGYERLVRHIMAAEKILPMTPACRCSTPAGGEPKPAGSGATRLMTGHGVAQRRRRRPMCIPSTARVRARPCIWPTSEALWN